MTGEWEVFNGRGYNRKEQPSSLGEKRICICFFLNEVLTNTPGMTVI